MIRAALLLAAVVAPAAALASPEAAPASGAPSSREAFERIKALAGRWTAATPNVPDGQLVVGWRVTAGGSAVMETLFEGAPHEMVSMYFLDGDELRMTHYCAAGNQPRMRYDARKSSADELAFVFDGGTSFDPKKDFHIHEGRIRFTSDGVTEQWAGWQDGRQVDLKQFTLVSRQ